MTVLNSGPPRLDGERRFGDRDGYRGGPRSGGEFGDKAGAPADYQPAYNVQNLSFLVILCELLVL